MKILIEFCCFEFRLVLFLQCDGLLKYNFETYEIVIGFQVLTAVVMKSSIFWDKLPCGPFEINRLFGGTCRLNLQGRGISSACGTQLACYLLSRCFPVCHILRTLWRRRRHVTPKRLLTFNGLHGIISQKIEQFILNNEDTGSFTFLVLCAVCSNAGQWRLNWYFIYSLTK
jgi:hypothetical protein